MLIVRAVGLLDITAQQELENELHAVHRYLGAQFQGSNVVFNVTKSKKKRKIHINEGIPKLYIPRYLGT